MVNFKNLHVLTDYFQQAHMRTAGGQVRHIILSEEGFTSDSISRGKVYDIQAAAFAYSYYLVDNNPYIDAFILNRRGRHHGGWRPPVPSGSGPWICPGRIR